MSSLFEATIALAGFVALAFFYWNVMVLEGDRVRIRRWSIDWVGKGLLVPLLLWVFFNSGSTPILPPFVDRVMLGQVKGSFNQFAALTSPAMLVIASYWGAVSLAWLIPNALDRFESRQDILVALGFWGVVMFLPAALILFWGGWMWAGLAIVVWLFPLVHFLPEPRETQPVKPMYARAIAKLKFGKYNEAELAVISELEKFEDDFDGWLMLAEIYANHFRDLGQAEQTIRDLVEQPSINHSEVSIAFHRLADWQLKLKGDPLAARASLQEISKRMPGTHLARMAQLRIRQLPASAEQMSEEAKGRKIHMPALSEARDETPSPELSAQETNDAVGKARLWVRKLEQDPNDLAAREHLARLMAEQLGNPLDAIGQIELLLGLPDQPEKKMAEWLAMVANWQIRFLQDWSTGKQSLERIIREFPQTAEAFAAQRKLQLHAMEEKMRKIRAVATPGAEQSSPRG